MIPALVCHNNKEEGEGGIHDIMPGTLINTLYPPQIATFMKAFLNTESAVVKFSLSPYNEETDIKRVHVSVTSQKSNANVLKGNNGVYVVEEGDFEFGDDGMYRISIPVSALSSSGWGINQFYKIQLRFDCNDNPNDTNIDWNSDNADQQKKQRDYMLSYQEYFSEWSSVCLIKPISEPSLSMRKFDDSIGSVIAFNKGIIPVSGNVKFENAKESETLESYQIQILSVDTKEVLYETAKTYTNENKNPNEINARINLQSLDTDKNSQFILKILAVTKNQYSFSKSYTFQIAEFSTEEKFNPLITIDGIDYDSNGQPKDITIRNEDGIVVVHVKNDNAVFGILYVKRASSLDNFSSYEDIYSKKVNGSIDITIEDNTVSSLVWYRYYVQLEDSSGTLTEVFRSHRVIPNFYDAIISRGDRQLRLKYNYKVSSLKPVVNRAKIDTLGGKYPKFAENAVLNYKQFGITGVLSAINDENQLFLNQVEYFGDDRDGKNEYSNFLAYNQVYYTDIPKDQQDEDEILPEDYRQGFRRDNSKGVYLNYDAYMYNDFFWEREFREEAVKWLNDGEPKLYRSMTEGSMIVMITDVNLTPNNSLSRRMYDFSATVYEIADASSLETLDDLGIYSRTLVSDNDLSSTGEIPSEDYAEKQSVGQLYHYATVGGENVLDVITEDLQHRYAGVLSDREIFDVRINNVKVFFEDKPKMYYFDGESFNNFSIGSNEQVVNPNRPEEKIKLGYKLEFVSESSPNRVQIFVNEKGYYQFPDFVSLKSLVFGNGVGTVTVEYLLDYKEKKSRISSPSMITISETVVGQESGTYSANEYLGNIIKSKYNFIKYDSKGVSQYYQKMQFWKGISLDVTPYAIAHIKYRGMDNYTDYMVGKTGILNLLKDFKIEDMCFLGIRMEEKEDTSLSGYLREWECCFDDKGYSDISQVVSPSVNTVYSIGDKLKIYYRDGHWYDYKKELDSDKKSKKTGIAAVPVQGTVNYYGDIVQTNY